MQPTIRVFLIAVCTVTIAAMACSSDGTSTPTLVLTTQSELEELADRVEAAEERAGVLSNWAIALEAAYKHPDNPLYCKDFALIFRPMR